jgi:hypothetical protein
MEATSYLSDAGKMHHFGAIARDSRENLLRTEVWTTARLSGQIASHYYNNTIATLLPSWAVNASSHGRGRGAAAGEPTNWLLADCCLFVLPCCARHLFVPAEAVISREQSSAKSETDCLNVFIFGQKLRIAQFPAPHEMAMRC